MLLARDKKNKTKDLTGIKKMLEKNTSLYSKYFHGYVTSRTQQAQGCSYESEAFCLSPSEHLTRPQTVNVFIITLENTFFF